MTTPRLYLDHASRWPLRPEAQQAWLDAQQVALGDPTRRHLEARSAADLLERATVSAAATLGATDRDVIWTSGGTEAVHLAVLGTARAAERRGDDRRHLVVGAIEHSSVLRAAERLRAEHGYEIDTVGVDRAGLIDPDEVAAALREDTLAVHLQHANHEVGAIQPTFEVRAACERVGALLHVDACQSVGQLGLRLEHLGADLLSASGAKFGGLPGTGLLALGPRARVAALLEGDDRQRRRRAGSLDVAAVAATAVALAVATDRAPAEHRARELVRRHLRERLPAAVEDLQVHGPLADAHPGIVAVSALYVDGEALVTELDAAGVAAHSGSSCASTSGEPSHVLSAMQALTHGHVRFSFGPELTIADADQLVATFARIVAELRERTGRQVPASR